MKHTIIHFVLIGMLSSCLGCSDDETLVIEEDVAEMAEEEQETAEEMEEEEPETDFTILYPQFPTDAFFDGNIVNADYWSDEPKILSAGLGFCDIVGIQADELTQEVVEAAGGAWRSDVACNGTAQTLTSLESVIGRAYIIQSPYGELKDGAIGLDGLPVVFSWPVMTNTLDLTDFKVTLNTGEEVYPYAIGPFPNIEENERNTIVLYGEFANKRSSADPESRFPVRVDVIADDSPLQLFGPNNQVVSAIGLSWENTSSPYDENNGPRLVGAKLNFVGNEPQGEGLQNPIWQQQLPPNHEFALYGGGDFRLRMLTSGGFSPDGVGGVLPSDFEKFFRLHVTGPDGSTVLMEKVNTDYEVMGGTLKVIGLSELGPPEGNGVVYDECYQEDGDNYIDIILVGDEAAARNITFLEIPSLSGGYDAFYNPGGPGTTPVLGETYTQPGPPDMEPVIIALDNPMRVSN
ncbi:MAG: hypothetical protein Mars2KO_11930 [Maribacter sp.]